LRCELLIELRFELRDALISALERRKAADLGLIDGTDVGKIGGERNGGNGGRQERRRRYECLSFTNVHSP